MSLNLCRTFAFEKKVFGHFFFLNNSNFFLLSKIIFLERHFLKHQLTTVLSYNDVWLSECSSNLILSSEVLHSVFVQGQFREINHLISTCIIIMQSDFFRLFIWPKTFAKIWISVIDLKRLSLTLQSFNFGWKVVCWTDF